VLGHHFGDNWAEHSGQCSDTVRHSHQDACVAWSDIQVIHVEPCASQCTHSLTQHSLQINNKNMHS